MEESWKKLLLFGMFFIIVEATHLTRRTYTHEYILITDLKMSWTEAQSYCRAEYSDLATIPRLYVNIVISEMAKSWETPFWIGLYEDVSIWKWSLVGKRYYTGVEEDYRQWQEGQPDNAGADVYCVSIMEDGLWMDNSCTVVKMPFICFADGSTDQYVLVTEQKSWFEAQTYCRKHHTDLVSVRSSAENQELRSRLQANNAAPEAWIGLHKDSWRWSDGSSSTFRQWWQQQPSHGNSSQACAAMLNGSWNNSKCDSELSILCQEIIEVTAKPSVESTTIRQSVKRTTVKIRLQTSFDLNDSTIRLGVSQQLEAVFHLHGFTDVKLILRTLRPEPQPIKTDDCGERIKENLKPGAFSLKWN